MKLKSLLKVKVRAWSKLSNFRVKTLQLFFSFPDFFISLTYCVHISRRAPEYGLQEARQSCKEKGGKLVTIETKVELTFLATIFENGIRSQS